MVNTLQNGNTTRNLLFLLVLSSDHITGATGKSPTVTLSKNGAAFAAPSGAVTEIANGWYQVAANATDANTNGPLLLHATATACDPADYPFEVVAYNPDDGVHLGLTALPNAAANATNGLAAPVARGGTAQAGGATSITLDAGASATTDFYKNNVVDLVGGTGQGQCRTITAYNGTTKVATVDHAWATNPDATSVFAVRCADNPNLDSSLQVAANAVNGSVTGSVASVTGNVGGNVVGSVASVTGAVGSVTGAVGSVTAAVTVGTNNDKTGYALATLDSFVLQSGTAQAGSTSTTLVLANAANGTTNDLYKYAVVKIYGGTGAGQARGITGYTAASRTATVDRPWTTTPDNSSTYAVLALEAPGAMANWSFP